MPNTGWVKTGSLAKYYESLSPYTKCQGGTIERTPMAYDKEKSIVKFTLTWKFAFKMVKVSYLANKVLNILQLFFKLVQRKVIYNKAHIKKIKNY